MTKFLPRISWQFHFLFLLFIPFCLQGQWNTNTAENLLVSGFESSDIQTISTQDGKLWVAFYHFNSGNYDMRAQLFDADGNKLLGPDGVLVSNKPSGSATFVFSVAADHDGNFIIGMQDMRGGSNQTAVVYKLSQQGLHLWSPDGVILGTGLAPYPAVLSNGEVVVAWNSSTSNTLEVHKITSQGTLAWTTPVQLKVGTSLTTRGQVIANLDGKFTIVYQRRGFGISTTLYAQHFNNNGTELYAPLQIGNLTTSGARYYSISVEGDTTYFGYYAAQGNRFNSYLQRINPNGTIPFGMNGSVFNTSTNTTDNYQQMTSIRHEPGSPFVWSVCSFSDPNQNNFGVYVQKFAKSNGARLLTDQGKMVYPVTSSRVTQAADLLLVNDAPLFITYDNNYKIYFTKLTANGEFAWTYNNIELSSTTASLGNAKGRFNAGFVGSSRIAAVWSENRTGFSQAFIQGVSTNGVIGAVVSTQGGVPAEISIPGGSLQLTAAVFPSVASQAVEWTVIPQTGNASISPTGLITALENGVVSAVATSVQDNTVSASIEITISGQAVLTPVVQTLPADQIQFYAARLNAMVNANNSITNAVFEWGITEAYGNTVSANPAEVSGNVDTPVNAVLNGLQPNQTYHFRIKATNAFGTTFGQNQNFTTTCLLAGTIGNISGDFTVCNNAAGLVYSINPFPNATSYVWTLPDGFTIVGGENTHSIIVDVTAAAQTGSISVYATNGNCLSESAAPVEITVIQAPAAAVISAVGTVLTSSIAVGNQWFLNNEPIEGATDQVHVALVNGLYHVVVTQNGCSSPPSNSINVVSVSLPENHFVQSLLVFPNPGKGLFEISGILQSEDEIAIEIFDSYGRLAASFTDLPSNGWLKKQLDISAYSSGIYWLVLKNQNASAVRKLIVNR